MKVKMGRQYIWHSCARSGLTSIRDPEPHRFRIKLHRVVTKWVKAAGLSAA
jgi:hypothetical protein